MIGWIVASLIYLAGALAAFRIVQASITPNLWGRDSRAKVAALYVKFGLSVIGWPVLAIFLAIYADELSPIEDGRRKKKS